MQDHLSSEGIQEFLDHGISREEKKQIVSHLYACSQCRQEFEQYKSLYQVLETEEQYELSSNFTQNLISQLTPNQPLGKRERWNDSIFAFAGIIISLIAAFYFLGSQGIQPYIITFREMIQKIKIIPLNTDLSFFNILINPYLVAFIGIIAVILVLDRVVLNKRMLHFM